MSWAHVVSNATIRFYNAIRSKRAVEAAHDTHRGSIGSLVGHRYALVVTFRASGAPVTTPVWFGMADGRVYFRSVSPAGKLDRIAKTPGVLVGPCTSNGRPLGPPFEARAAILDAGDEARAEAALRANYGISRRVYLRLIGARVEARYVEVRPSAVGGTRDGSGASEADQPWPA